VGFRFADVTFFLTTRGLGLDLDLGLTLRADVGFAFFETTFDALARERLIGLGS
jgi:hypothetical protein